MDRRYAIFDMDGTLVDSMPYWFLIPPQYMERKGLKGKASPALLKRMERITFQDMVPLLKAELGYGTTVTEVYDSTRDIMRTYYAEYVGLKQGVREYLERLKGEEVRMCVASASPIDMVTSCLRKNGIDGYFDDIFSCEEVGLDKSTPRFFEYCARKLGAVENREAAVFEDTLKALKTARAGGFHVVGVYEESQRRDWDEILLLSDETTVNYDNL